MRIAILGATSHIAKNIIYYFKDDKTLTLSLFARNEEAVRCFLDSVGVSRMAVQSLEAFPDCDCDVVINCVGIADPQKQRDAGVEIFRLTERFDNIILDYLAGNKNVIYINFSSGAVYGTGFDAGVTENTLTQIAINNILPADYYRIAKLNAESKHRAMPSFSIIDLRVFSFFSKFIDLSSRFLLTEMVRSIKSDIEFETTRNDIVRDFIAPSDLYSLVRLCIAKPGVNEVFDVFSRAPVRKQELIDAFIGRYGMKVHYIESNSAVSPTGRKDKYLSTNYHAKERLGYLPHFSSLETVIEEADYLVDKD
jgi:nucleoside-diphosphate-sugar epimerase